MKTLHSDAEPFSNSAETKSAPAIEPPLKICVVFDEDSSAGNAEVLIKHVASNFGCETRSFRFDELDQPAPGVAAARHASATDIVVLALGDDRMLPDHVQYWLGLLIGLRGKDRRGALVVMFSHTVASSSTGSSLMDYLAAVATVGGLDFIPQQKRAADVAGAAHASPDQRMLRQPSLSFPGRKYCSSGGSN